MATFTWKNGEVPQGMKVTQVYGLVFTTDGRMLLIVKHKKDRVEYSLAGGTPEDFDSDREATLRRELIEEANTTLGEKAIIAGYQEVDEENGKPAYAQLRMVALIDKIGEVKPDPDNGETYGRVLASPQRVIELLGWGETGRAQVMRAVEIAKEQLGLTTFSDKEENV